MTNLWHEIRNPALPDTIFVVVESPKGSKNAFEFDPKNNVMVLKRVLEIKYPWDYGFVPQTYAEDGDAVDALVLSSEPTHPGILLKARPVAVMNMIDGGICDDKILCVSVKDPKYSGMKEAPPRVMKEIGEFFKVYKRLEGKSVKITGWKGLAEAKKAIERSARLYERKFS